MVPLPGLRLLLGEFLFTTILPVPGVSSLGDFLVRLALLVLLVVVELIETVSMGGEYPSYTSYPSFSWALDLLLSTSCMSFSFIAEDLTTLVGVLSVLLGVPFVGESVVDFFLSLPLPLPVPLLLTVYKNLEGT